MASTGSFFGKIDLQLNRRNVMSRKQVLAVVAGILSLATGIFAVRIFWFSPGPAVSEDLPQPPPPVKEFSLNNKRLSGPYTHKNLTIYLVHGENTLPGAVPLTLEQAIKGDWAFVHETGDVNELSIENRSTKLEVFVQAGDIVKGGQQDRVLGVDLMIPANSGRIPIDSFCVEHGRWTPRGDERRDRFNGSTDYAPSKQMKLATRTVKSQGKVWDEVSKSQEKLSVATSSNTMSNISRSSLQLTLENDRVREDSSEFVNALSGIIDGKTDVIGFLFTINNEINSSDIYGSSGLFQKLWPKLLKAAAIEAIAERHEDNAAPTPAKIAEIESFFATAENAAVTEERKVTDRIKMTTRESDTTAYIQTLDRGNMLHLNYILK
jgi:hypothetical protein